MRSRTIIIMILMLILGGAASTAVLISEQSDNLDITLKTNGTDVTVQASSVLFFNKVPDTMMAEMKDKALIDVQNDTSTVDTVKDDMKTIAQNYHYNATVKIDSQFGTDQLPMPATVSGTSMVPTLKDGQSIILLKTRDFKVGDIVVARHPSYGLIVKRVSQIKDGQVYLMSDNRETIVTNQGILKGLDTWLPIENVVGVVKVY